MPKDQCYFTFRRSATGANADKKIPNANAFGILWRCHPDLNWGVKVLQTFDLPLGHGTIWIDRSRNELLSIVCGADYEARTRYLHLGKVALYQMS